MADVQPLTIEDFSGGITDNAIGGVQSQAKALNNYSIKENGKITTRPGFNSAVPYRVTSAYTLRNIIKHGPTFLLRGENRVYFYSNIIATEILNPQGGAVFSKGNDSTKVMTSYSNGQTILTNDELERPRKIYKNESGVFKASPLGLPDPILIYAITLANELRTDFNAHIANTSQHTTSDAVNTVSSPQASDYASVLTLTNALTTAYTAHLASIGRHPVAPAGGHSLASTSQVSLLVDAVAQLKDLKAKFNLHDGATPTHTTGGLNQIVSPCPDAEAISFGAGALNYKYLVHFQYRYFVEDTEMLERSQVVYLSAQSSALPVTIKLPSITSLIDSYDTANIKVMIYRTIHNGTTFYKAAEITNGTATYADNMADGALQLQPTSYVEGGVIEDERPPAAKFNIVLNDTLYLAHVIDTGIIKKNRLLQSKPGVVSSVPSGNYIDFDSEIVGLSQIGDYPVVFTQDNNVYRVEGQYDSFGGGGMFEKIISSKVTSVNQESIVATTDDIYFASPEDGFWSTDGFKVFKISQDIPTTYLNLSDRENIQGTYHKVLESVMWSVKTESSLTYNDSIFVCHLRHKTPLGGRAFSTWSGEENFRTSAIYYHNGQVMRCDPRGYLLVHDGETLEDLFIDTALSVSQMATTAIIYDWQSVSLDFGSTNVRKFLSRVSVTAENVTSISLQLGSQNDNSGVYVDLTPITQQAGLEWGDLTFEWGDASFRWNYYPVLAAWRYFPRVAQQPRCMYRSIRMTNSYVEIDDSQNALFVSVDATLKTVTFLNPVNVWISDAVNYYISFESDDYVQQYLITARTSATVLAIQDASNTLANSSSANWKISGFKKRQIFNPLTLTINYQYLTMTQDTVKTDA